eukprot:COSAG02_NODE_1633_length_11567_cov_16.719567_5_plen_83_part_00
MTDRRQQVADKKKGRLIYKGLWTDEEDQMLRSLVAKMADLPRSGPARCYSARACGRAAAANLDRFGLRAVAATKSGCPSEKP